MKTPTKNSQINRIPSLDGSRTVSIALVILSHSLHASGIEDHNLGSLGVRVFFVISGFLITGLLIDELTNTSTISLGKFYFRRTLRIFPPYYFYLFSIIFVSLILESPIALIQSFLPAFTYTSNYIDPQRWDLGHSWSLSVEEQFYLLYPGVLLLLGKNRTILLLCLIIVISPIIRVIDFKIFGEARWVGMGFHSNADALSVGCLLAYFRVRLQSDSCYLYILKSKYLLIALPLIFILNDQSDHPIIYSFSSAAVNLLIALCLDCAVTNNRGNALGNFLNSSPMVSLGLMSYSIYLWQQLFLNPENVYWFNAFPLNFLGIALCSSFSYFIVEKYSLRIRQYWDRKVVTKPRSISTKNVRRGAGSMD